MQADWSDAAVVGQEAAWEQLALAVQEFRSGCASSTVFISGASGVGKSLLARHLANCLVKEDSTRNVEPISINGFGITKACDLITLVHRGLDPHVPRRGVRIHNRLQALHRYLLGRSLELVVVVDEADTLFAADLEDVIRVARLLGEGGVRMALILVGQDFGRHELQAAVGTGGRLGHVALKAYTAAELHEILEDRVRRSVVPGTVGDDVLALVAEEAAVYGDARFALDLLKRALALAERRGALRVRTQDVEEAVGSTATWSLESAVALLSEQEALALAAVAESGRKGPEVTSVVEAKYRQMCQEAGVRCVGRSQFWKLLKRLELRRLVVATYTGKGVPGNSRVLEAVPEAVSALHVLHHAIAPSGGIGERVEKTVGDLLG